MSNPNETLNFKSWMNLLGNPLSDLDQALFFKGLQDHPEWVNQTNELLVSPLMRASEFGHLQIVKKLIQVKADLNLQDQDGWSSLIWASYGGHGEVVQELIQAGVDLNLQAKFNWTALMLASSCGYLEVVQKLTQAEVDPLGLNSNQQTALDLAKKNGHDKIVRFLETYVDAYVAKQSLQQLSQLINPLDLSSSNLRSEVSDPLLPFQGLRL